MFHPRYSACSSLQRNRRRLQRSDTFRPGEAAVAVVEYVTVMSPPSVSPFTKPDAVELNAGFGAPTARLALPTVTVNGAGVTTMLNTALAAA